MEGISDVLDVLIALTVRDMAKVSVTCMQQYCAHNISAARTRLTVPVALEYHAWCAV
jgi:hypothetical protein